MLKWGFGTATLVDVEGLHRTEGNIIHSVNQMTYVKALDSAVNFNTEVVESLSERVKVLCYIRINGRMRQM